MYYNYCTNPLLNSNQTSHFDPDPIELTIYSNVTTAAATTSFSQFTIDVVNKLPVTVFIKCGDGLNIHSQLTIPPLATIEEIIFDIDLYHNQRETGGRIKPQIHISLFSEKPFTLPGTESATAIITLPSII